MKLSLKQKAGVEVAKLLGTSTAVFVSIYAALASGYGPLLGVMAIVTIAVYSVFQLYQMKLWQLETKAAKAKALG